MLALRGTCDYLQTIIGPESSCWGMDFVFFRCLFLSCALHLEYLKLGESSFMDRLCR